MLTFLLLPQTLSLKRNANFGEVLQRAFESPR